MSEYLLLEDPNGKTIVAKCTAAGLLKCDLGSATLEIDTSLLATSAKQDTGNTSIASIDTKTPAKGTAAMAGSMPVTIATDDTMFTKLVDPTTSLAITPSDSTDLTATVTKGIWVGTGGNVAIKLTGDSGATTLLNVPSGTFIPGRFKAVMATNTTATSIIGFGS